MAYFSTSFIFFSLVYFYYGLNESSRSIAYMPTFKDLFRLFLRNSDSKTCEQLNRLFSSLFKLTVLKILESSTSKFFLISSFFSILRMWSHWLVWLCWALVWSRSKRLSNDYPTFGPLVFAFTRVFTFWPLSFYFISFSSVWKTTIWF